MRIYYKRHNAIIGATIRSTVTFLTTDKMPVRMLHVVQICSLFLSFLFVNASGEKPPNIVCIVADDLGWNDVSFHGSPQMPTPNIDAMASDGIVLSNYYVNPICTPSRSALMSGYLPIHTGLQHDVIYASEPYGLPLNYTLLPQFLRNLGYATHAVGKWHLGFYKWDFTPTRRGFDSFMGYFTGHESYYDHTANEPPYWGYDMRDNDRVAWELGGKYATDIFTHKAVDIIKKHNGSTPLFLYLAHLAVHAGNSYSTLEGLPQWLKTLPQITDVRRKIFGAMVSALDDSVGQIFRALNENRLLQNTIVVFTTDNGGAAGGIDGSIGSNWPLRGTKYTLWEGGVRGVGVVWSPLLGNTHGAKRSQLMHISDWLPTLYQAAGGKVEELGPIDGTSHWNSFINGTQPSSRKEILLNIDPIEKSWAIRSGNYKLLSGTYGKTYDQWFGPSGRDNNTEPIFVTLPSLADKSMVAATLRNLGRNFKTPTLDWYRSHEVNCSSANSTTCDSTKAPCLFNIVNDPCEYNNLADKKVEIVNTLLNKVNIYAQSSVRPLKVPSDPDSNPDNCNFTWGPWL